MQVEKQGKLEQKSFLSYVQHKLIEGSKINFEVVKAANLTPSYGYLKFTNIQKYITGCTAKTTYTVCVKFPFSFSLILSHGTS